MGVLALRSALGAGAPGKVDIMDSWVLGRGSGCLRARETAKLAPDTLAQGLCVCEGNSSPATPVLPWALGWDLPSASCFTWGRGAGQMGPARVSHTLLAA